MLGGMRTAVAFGCSVALLVGCERRGYAPLPNTPNDRGAWNEPPAGVPDGSFAPVPSPPGAPVLPGAAWDNDPRVQWVPGWGPAFPTDGRVASYEPGAQRPSGTALGQRAAQAAIALHGRPYCWGGTGPECYDCSGLTVTAWHAAGHSIPRTSELQHEQLTPVAMSALQLGDILWRPGHVGLYVGNGWAIHAPGSGKPVQYQPASKFDEARRPF